MVDGLRNLFMTDLGMVFFQQPAGNLFPAPFLADFVFSSLSYVLALVDSHADSDCV